MGKKKKNKAPLIEAGELSQGKGDGTPPGKDDNHKKLSVWPATAICGNDITSSCLYVSALSIVAAGWYSWISLVIVAVVLFLFRTIYAEVVGALPLNGGAYNALLNTTSKSWASMAACLTLLSYIATAVISAVEGMHYVANLGDGVSWFPDPHLFVTVTTIILLTVFAMLAIMGIKESSVVAMGIFGLHMFTLCLLAVFALFYIFSGDAVLAETGQSIWEYNKNAPVPQGSVMKAVFFGFAAAMLGISGFESSSNFVEEQKPGVFPKTLRNMWVAVSVFNPLMCILALSIFPLYLVAQNQDALLAAMGNKVSGQWLKIWVSVDAALVLSGAVLTSFIGVTGLVHRMTLDRCLPQFLLKSNKRGSLYRIIIGFLLLCISILFISEFDLDKIYMFSREPEVRAASVSPHPNSSPVLKINQIQILGKRFKLDSDEKKTRLFLEDDTEITNLDITPTLITGILPEGVNVKGKCYVKNLGRGRSQLIYFEKGKLKESDSRVDNLAGVYTISFLLVMAFFAFGNMLLKVKRARLPRPTQANWIVVLIATFAVGIGVIGNVLRKPEYPFIFLLFFIPFSVLVITMLRRIDLLKMMAYVVRAVALKVQVVNRKITKSLNDKMEDINAQEVVFFTRGDNIANLNQAMLYVQRNEHTNRMKIVTIVRDPKAIPDRLAKDIEFLDEAYPEINIEFVVRKGSFNPELLSELSQEWNVPLNFMFIGTPGDHFPQRIADLGGVRLII